MADTAALAAFLHARINEQRPDEQELIPKYHRLVDEHAVEHLCSDDDLYYDAGLLCPWLSSFATMWRDDPGYLAAWPRTMTWGTGRLPAGREEPKPPLMTFIHREAGTRYSEAAAAALIGQNVLVNVGPHPTPLQARVLAATVTDDATGLNVTVEIPRSPGTTELKRLLKPALGSFSIGSAPPR